MRWICIASNFPIKPYYYLLMKYHTLKLDSLYASLWLTLWLQGNVDMTFSKTHNWATFGWYAMCIFQCKIRFLWQYQIALLYCNSAIPSKNTVSANIKHKGAWHEHLEILILLKLVDKVSFHLHVSSTKKKLQTCISFRSNRWK